MMGRLHHVGKNGEYLSQEQLNGEFMLTQTQADWFLGRTNEFIEGPAVHTCWNGRPKQYMDWNDEAAQPRFLSKEVSLRFVRNTTIMQGR